MRSLGEAGGLIPRPLNRYETARQGGPFEMPEAGQAMDGIDMSLDYGRSFRDASLRTVPTMTEAGLTEDVVQPGGQTDALPRNDPGEESIEVRRSTQRGISGERIDNVDVTKDEPTVAARRPMDKTQVSRHSSAVRPVSGRIPSQGVDGAAAHGPQANVASPERRELRTTERAEQAESSSRTRNDTDDLIDKEHPPLLVKAKQISSDPLRLTLGEGSFRGPHHEETVPSAGERPPVVRIRIGRIEVRAVEQPVPTPSKKVVEPPRSSLPLDQYLRRRSREA